MQDTAFEPVIGLEVHVQLLTESKMFCSCSTAYVGTPPNTHVCPVCLGMPGVLPAMNKKAVEYTIMTALALNCTIPEHTKFDRKNYPYPDLMKGYQISQYDQPFSRDGWLAIEVNGQRKRLGITRVHLEEDVAKLFHRASLDGETYSLVDVNRSGVPLMEIVSEPDMRSPEEARLYLMKLRAIVQYLGVSTGDMEDGTFRCDANISIRPQGVKELLTKVEVKNMNSFRAVYRALEYEAERQVQVWREGGRITQETRGWVEEQGATVSQRSKEYAHDYRYFPEPDLPPMATSRKWVEEIKARLPELPEARRDRFVSEYGLPVYDASLLTASKSMADFFEETVKAWKSELLTPEGKAKATSNWILTELNRLLNASGLEVHQAKVSPAGVAELLDLVERGVISGSLAKTVFEEAFHSGKRAGDIVREKGLTQISDAEAIAAVVEQVIVDNPQAVADYKKGKQQAVTFLVGQVMKATKGRANPAVVNALLREKLG